MTRPKVTFEYYFNEYCGGCRGVLDKASFDRYILPAFCEIKSLCGRAKDVDLNCSEVLQCLCEVAEKLYLAQGNGRVKSETVDGYSVTYSDVNDTKTLHKIILKHLWGTGLLYAGVE